MSIPFKKYGYELNPITNEYKQPQIFLVNKRIHKIGELYPVENLRITVNEINQADEVSFTYYRKADGQDTPLFDKLDDLSIVLVDGYGYFEIAIEKNENSSVTKSVTGISLGHAELSQILTTLEINTDDDIHRNDYDESYPTVFYRSLDHITDRETEKKYRESSLLHRILSCVPHYKIGSVSKTLHPIQREFSWSDTDILSIFNDIAEEINCVFDIQVYLEDGKPQRVIHVYDLQYCGNCYNALDEHEKISSNTYKYRTIINGKCQNCGSPEGIADIGMDTNIFISTENLSDEISIRGEKDSIKNCFKVTGGDDLITSAVQGLAMSASDRIMMFSDKQKQEMSPELREQLGNYETEYIQNIGDYEELLETEYNIFDIKHYLRSSKMPPHKKEILKTDEALYTVLNKIKQYYNNRFFIKSYDDYSHNAARISLQNMFSSFMPEGYSFSMEGSTITDKTTSYDPGITYQWYGKIKIYNTGNRDDSYTLHLQPSRSTYITQGENEETYTFNDSSMQNTVTNFSVVFSFADKSDEDEYREYVEQHTQYILSTIDQSYDNEIKHPWNLYSYTRLESFYDGYETCIDSLMELLCSEEKGTGNYNILMEMKTSYQSIQRDIQNQMDMLREQIFAICAYHGEYDSDFLDADGKVKYSLKYHKDLQSVFQDMLDSSNSGGYQGNNDNAKVYKINKFIGEKPFQCKICGSSNVSESTNGNICSNPGCESSDIYTYLDIMENIHDSYCSHKNDTIRNMRETYQQKFNLENYLGDEQLYAELRSFIREDVYTNDNYTSDGLNNTQLIEHAKELRAKAEQELAKACMAQYTIDAPLSSIVGQKPFLYQGILVNDDYSAFRINNFVRVRIDGEIYKMRIASMALSFPVTDKIDVTFTNVTNYKGGTLNDVKDIIDKAASMSTSYSYVATQAEKGGAASAQFDTLKKEGLDAALMAVKAGRDQDVVIDSHGILLRRKIQETDTYSQYQMKLIDRNIVMTTDNWESAELAIGLGMYNGEPVYGIWAKLLCGDLMVTNKLHVKNDNGSVIIDESGIDITNGSIKMQNKNGYSVCIDPNENNIFSISNDNEKIIYLDSQGNGHFDGVIHAIDGSFVGTVTAKDILATNGKIGGWEINRSSLFSGDYNNNYIQLDSSGKSIISKNAEDKVVITSGRIQFLKESTPYTTIRTTHWSDTTIYGVGINSEADSKFISFGNKKSSSDNAYLTPLVLNYGLNPNGDTQDILIYGTTKITGKIYFNNNSYLNSSGTTYNGIYADALKSDRVYAGNYVHGDYALDVNGESYFSSNIYFNNKSYMGSWASGGAYFSSNIYAKGTIYSEGYEVVNKNTNLTEIYKTLTAYGNIHSGFGDGYNFACVGYVQDNFQKSSSSDLRLKKDILPVNDIKPIYLNFKPKQYSFKDGCAENDKVHYGLLAQEVIHALEENRIDWKNSDLIEEYETRSYMDEGRYAGKTAYRINYENLHALHISFAQEMYKELEQLKREIASLKKGKEMINQ